jgi:hypothetical protein
MTQNIYLLAFGTFGNPYGFRQSFLKFGNENIAKSIKTFDLNTNAIKLFKNSTMYSIRKEIANGLSSIAYSKYTFAKEKNSDRGGTFIGSSIIFTNEIAEENLTINKLNEFHKILINRNIVDETIIVNHSDNFSVELPQDFDKLGFHLKNLVEPTNFGNSNSNLLVYSEIKDDHLQQNFKKALELLNNYDSIFFTNSKEIVEFTNGKGLYKVVDEENGFKKEIQILRDEKKKRLQSTIHDFEKELSELEENKRVTIQDFKEKIEKNSILHQENNRKIEESKRQINDIENKYSEFSKKIRGAINHINSNKKIEDVKLFHNENKREFINFVNQNIKPNYLNNIDNIQPKTSLTLKQQHNSDWLQSNSEFLNKEQTRRKKPFKIFKLLSFLFFVLWILTLLYFIFFNKTKQNPINENNKKIIENPIIIDNTKMEIELSPVPNSKLNSSDIENIAKNLKKNLTIEEVVKLIFEKNPIDIKKHYENQLDLYSKKIFELNKNCFEQKNGVKYYKQDTIKDIPSFNDNNQI